MSSLLGFDIYDQPIEHIDFSRDRMINTINPHSYCVAKEDSYFKEVLQKSDILLPDGIGIVWGVRFLHSKKIKKIAGYDVFHYLMNTLNQNHQSCFFLGAAPQTLEHIHQRAAIDFPNVKVGSYSPPYKATFTDEESKKMVEEVNAISPMVLFVGMTAPKQEKWAFTHKEVLKADVICSIGAVFDFYAGTVKRPSPFWINLGLEWFPRFLNEPRRLAHRNLVSTPKFVFDVIKAKVTQSK